MKSPEFAILEDLITLNSVNPALHPQGGGEGAVADYIAARCEALGLTVTRQRVFEGRDNLIIELDAGRAQTLLFESHMDTVPGGGMNNPFQPYYENGRLHGRGSCDTKATLAGMLAAMEAAATAPQSLSCNLMLCCTVDEEHGATGIKRFVELGYSIDGAVVGEPTELRVVIAHKGCARFAVTTHGVAAHSAMPQQGRNAILQMAEVLDLLRLEIIPELGTRHHDLCGSPTLSVGTIHGGSAVNIVPDHCEIEIDRRLIPGEDATQTMVEFETQLQGYKPGCTIRPLLLDPPLNTAPDADIVRAAQSVARFLGLNENVAGVPYGSDASKLQAVQGIPTIVFGPGSIALAHSDNEYVPVHEVELAARFYRKLSQVFGLPVEADLEAGQAIL